MIELQAILVLFRSDLSTAEIELFFLDGLGNSFLQWMQVFEDHPKLYAIQVASGSASQWKEVLMQVPEVAWAECLSIPTFAIDRAA